MSACLLPVCVQAQSQVSSPRRSVAAVRLPESQVVTVDGRLDEAFWKTVPSGGGLHPGRPGERPPGHRADRGAHRFSRDDLYLGVICFDSEPDKWLGYQRRRDEFLASDDRFMWTIDTFLDARSGYFFEMNPSGLMADSLIGRRHRQPRSGTASGTRGSTAATIGWTIEIEIPFRTLNFDPNSDAWGINFQRTVRRKNEDSIWMGWARNQGLQRMTNAGLLTGHPATSARDTGSTSSRTRSRPRESSPGRGQHERRPQTPTPAWTSSTTRRRGCAAV